MGRQLSNYMRHDKLENYSVWIPERKRTTTASVDVQFHRQKSVGMYSCHQKRNTQDARLQQKPTTEGLQKLTKGTRVNEWSKWPTCLIHWHMYPLLFFCSGFHMSHVGLCFGLWFGGSVAQLAEIPLLILAIWILTKVVSLWLGIHLFFQSLSEGF